MRRHCSILALVACLALPTAALAMPAGGEPVDELVVGAAPAVVQPDAADAFEVRVDRLVQAAIEKAVIPALKAQAAAEAARAQPQVVYVPAAQQATGSSGDTGGLLGKVGGILGILGFLGMGLTVVFKLWTGERSTAVRMAIVKAAEAAWYSGEAVGGPTGDKIKASSEAFLKGLEALGIKQPDAQQLAIRDTTFEAMSKADKVAKARISQLTASAKAPVADPQMPPAA